MLVSYDVKDGNGDGGFGVHNGANSETYVADSIRQQPRISVKDKCSSKKQYAPIAENTPSKLKINAACVGGAWVCPDRV